MIDDKDLKHLIRDSYVCSFVTRIFPFVTHFSLNQMLMIDDKDLKHLIPMSLVGATFSRFFFFSRTYALFIFPPLKTKKNLLKVECIFFQSTDREYFEYKVEDFTFCCLFCFVYRPDEKKRKTFRAKLLKMC